MKKGIIFGLVLVVAIFLSAGIYLALHKTAKTIENETDIVDNTEIENNKTDVNDKKGNSYIFPNSSTELLDEKILTNYSLDDLTYAKNEIFARYGYDFKDKKIRSYFDNKEWYKPIAGKTVTVSELNSIEVKNIELINKAINEIKNEKVLTYEEAVQFFKTKSGTVRADNILPSNNGKFLIEATLYDRATINESQYQSLLKTGKIEIGGKEYHFVEDYLFNELGCISDANGKGFFIFKSKEGYAFWNETGGVQDLLYLPEETIKFYLPKNTSVYIGGGGYNENMTLDAYYNNQIQPIEFLEFYLDDNGNILIHNYAW